MSLQKNNYEWALPDSNQRPPRRQRGVMPLDQGPNSGEVALKSEVGFKGL